VDYRCRIDRAGRGRLQQEYEQQARAAPTTRISRMRNLLTGTSRIKTKNLVDRIGIRKIKDTMGAQIPGGT